jgi:hypothetical protein
LKRLASLGGSEAPIDVVAEREMIGFKREREIEPTLLVRAENGNKEAKEKESVIE